jgi:signal transduction histidine kinase
VEDPRGPGIDFTPEAARDFEEALHGRPLILDRNQAQEDRFGLEGIRQRVHLFGGEADIDSAVGRGTRIRAVLPLAAPFALESRTN